MERLVKMYLNGIKMRELTREFKVSRTTLYNVLNEYFKPLSTMENVSDMFNYVKMHM